MDNLSLKYTILYVVFFSDKIPLPDYQKTIYFTNPLQSTGV